MAPGSYENGQLLVPEARPDVSSHNEKKKKKRWTNRRRIWDSLLEAHQKDNVGVLVERAAHADPLSLASAEVDALSWVAAGAEEEDEMTSSPRRSHHPAPSPGSAYSLSDVSLVAEGQQVDVGLQGAGVDHCFVSAVKKNKTGWSLNEEEEEKETLWAALPWPFQVHKT